MGSEVHLNNGSCLGEMYSGIESQLTPPELYPPI